MNTIVVPSVGHEMNESRLRGRVYDTVTGRILDRDETLAALDRGDLVATYTVTRATHPSKDTHADDTVAFKHFDSTSPIKALSRDEIVAMFNRAEAIRAN